MAAEELDSTAVNARFVEHGTVSFSTNFLIYHLACAKDGRVELSIVSGGATTMFFRPRVRDEIKIYQPANVEREFQEWERGNGHGCGWGWRVGQGGLFRSIG